MKHTYEYCIWFLPIDPLHLTKWTFKLAVIDNFLITMFKWQCGCSLQFWFTLMALIMLISDAAGNCFHSKKPLYTLLVNRDQKGGIIYISKERETEVEKKADGANGTEIISAVRPAKTPVRSPQHYIDLQAIYSLVLCLSTTELQNYTTLCSLILYNMHFIL